MQWSITPRNRFNLRYYQNWIHNAYEFFGRESLSYDASKRPVVGETVFRV